MDISGRRSWIRAMVLVAVSYVAIGIGFAALAADANHVRLWRLAAWLASAAGGAAPIGDEHYRLRSSPRPTALHAGRAGGVGGFRPAPPAQVSLLPAWTPRPPPPPPPPPP